MIVHEKKSIGIDVRRSAWQFLDRYGECDKRSANVCQCGFGRSKNIPDAQAYVDENLRTLVPVRFVAESLGAKVGWEAHTARTIVEHPDHWADFLSTAAWNYKYPFQDQLLIYAQRPDATACIHRRLEQAAQPLGQTRGERNRAH